MLAVTEADGGATFAVRVSAGARRTAITGVFDGALKLSVQQAPERGKANKEVARLIAAALGLRAGEVDIFKGHTSRDKLVFVGAAERRKCARSW